MLRRLLAASLLACLAGCNNSVPTPPTSPSPPAPLFYVVFGTVSEMVGGVSRPLADATVVLQIVQPSTLRRQTSSTDHNGRYTEQVPTGRVYVFAEGPAGVEQPCVATAAIDKDTTIPDVELVPGGRSARPLSATSPIITGFVYETTPQGRKPLPGVAVVLFVPPFIIDHPVAQTETDDAGRFFLCRVNTPVQMVVSAGNGYQDWWQSIPGTGDMFFEIELRR